MFNVWSTARLSPWSSRIQYVRGRPCFSKSVTDNVLLASPHFYADDTQLLMVLLQSVVHSSSVCVICVNSLATTQTEQGI